MYIKYPKFTFIDNFIPSNCENKKYLPENKAAKNKENFKHRAKNTYKKILALISLNILIFNLIADIPEIY